MRTSDKTDKFVSSCFYVWLKNNKKKFFIRVYFVLYSNVFCSTSWFAWFIAVPALQWCGFWLWAAPADPPEPGWLHHRRKGSEDQGAPRGAFMQCMMTRLLLAANYFTDQPTVFTHCLVVGWYHLLSFFCRGFRILCFSSFDVPFLTPVAKWKIGLLFPPRLVFCFWLCSLASPFLKCSPRTQRQASSCFRSAVPSQQTV